MMQEIIRINRNKKKFKMIIKRHIKLKILIIKILNFNKNIKINIETYTHKSYLIIFFL